MMKVFDGGSITVWHGSPTWVNFDFRNGDHFQITLEQARDIHYCLERIIKFCEQEDERGKR